VYAAAQFSPAVSFSAQKNLPREETIMRAIRFLLAACAAAGIAWNNGKAQNPWPPPSPPAAPVVTATAPSAVNSQAFRQFLNSDSSYKTYSRLTPSRGFTRVTPFSVESRYMEPGYLKQINSQFGFESREYVPGYGGSWQTPWQAGGYVAPGYYRIYCGPPLPTPRP
jgi:hypothetical protein